MTFNTYKTLSKARFVLIFFSPLVWLSPQAYAEFDLLSIFRPLVQPQQDVLPNPTAHAEAEPYVYFDPADMKREGNRKRYFFDVVVVVNKHPDAQTIDIYKNGRCIKHSLVTTGRERPELPDPTGQNPNAPTHEYFSQTPTGYYNVLGLDIDHHSKTWQDGFMAWSVFFTNGIATHLSPHEKLDVNLNVARVDRMIGNHKNMHRNGSGGCVRLHAQDAKELFWLVRNTGGWYTAEEMYQRSEPGEPNFAREANEQMELDAEDHEHHPYDRVQMVPLIDRWTGKTIPDPAIAGNVKMKAGFKTLYIVENLAPEETPVDPECPLAPAITASMKPNRSTPPRGLEAADPAVPSRAPVPQVPVAGGASDSDDLSDLNFDDPGAVGSPMAPPRDRTVQRPAAPPVAQPRSEDPPPPPRRRRKPPPQQTDPIRELFDGVRNIIPF